MVNILKFLFNLYFEIRYRFLYYFKKNNNIFLIEIENAYFINKITKESKKIDDFNFIKIIGNEFIINIDNHIDHILDIGYKSNKKNYRIQFLINSNNSIFVFPLYNLDDIKNKINNQIIMIEDDSGNAEKNMERNRIFNQYSGPVGDFYKSKNIGITIYNLYSVKYNEFLFRDVRLKLEDLFLNEYEINAENQNKVFEFKRNLDETKINKYDTNEDYILKTYNKFNLDWKNTFMGVIYWIFGKKKNE
jgi:hypothetical protein